WKEGTEIYADWTEDDIWNVFGLGQVRTVPGFAQKILLKGNFADLWSEEAQKALNGPGATPLSLYHHQLLFVVKFFDCMFAGNNLLCLDGVGIGKTIQTVAAMGMYEWLRQVKTKEGRLPTRWANANGKRSTSDSMLAFQVPSGRVGSEYPNWPRRKTRLSNFTLFHTDRKYGIIAIDEIHLARKPGKAQVACTELRKMAHMTVGLTATP
ncbi:hypothetical protein BD414DRAFT_383520, partial [Trametes punicea]